MIDILIPTFNRAPFLKKNLNLLIEQIHDSQLDDKISILISDNFSEDETISIVTNIIENTNINIKLYRQTENIGLEKNAIFLLKKSSNDFIMYLGDDDYLPKGYLTYIFDKINNIDNLSCIIPGISGLYSNEIVRPSRNADFDEKRYEPSFKTVKQISFYGHQLSGVLLKRKGLYENYTADEKLRNIYLFIFFVAYNNLQGISIYAPKYQILVSQSNSKDWNYDNSGLLTEIFKNYKILFQNNSLKRNIMNFYIMNQQSWRLRIGKNLTNACKSFIHLEKDRNIDFLTKLLLPLQYIYLYIRFLLSKIRRLLLK